MNKLTFEGGNLKYEFCIENKKVIYGSNYNTKFNIMRICRQVFNKNMKSEFQEENQAKYIVKLNENDIKSKDWNYFEVHAHYNFENDLKLGTSSLIFQYLEALGKEIRFHEEVFTINNLLYSLSDDLQNEVDQRLDIHIGMNGLEWKQIVKMMSISLWNYDFLINQNDFSYKDYIILQLKLIHEISKRNQDQYYLITIDLQVMDEIIKKKLDEMTGSNLFLLIMTNQKHILKKIDEYVVSEQYFLDMNNEEEIFENVLNHYNGYIDLEEFKAEIISFIEGNYTKTTNKIKLYL